MLASEESSRWPSAAGRNTRALRRGEEPRLHPVAVIWGVYQRGGKWRRSGITERFAIAITKKRKKKKRSEAADVSLRCRRFQRWKKTTKAVGPREESVFLMRHINTARCCACTGSVCILGEKKLEEEKKSLFLGVYGDKRGCGTRQSEAGTEGVIAFPFTAFCPS